MPAFAPWREHRLQWIVLAVGVMVLAALIALAVHVYALLQPQRFTNLIERDLAGAGINLEMQAPAKPALFPRPAVRMLGFSLTNAGSTTPILRASGATIVVPWRALLRGDVEIERVEVDTPRIDLDELKALLARLPSHRGPPRLPTILTGVHMSQGTLISNGAPLLFELSLDTGELVPGRHFGMNASARTADGTRLTASLSTVPSSPHDGTIDLDAIRIEIARQAGVSMQLSGKGYWQGGESLALQLHGNMRYPSLAPPPPTSAVPVAGSRTPGSAPADASGATTTDKIALDIRPARGKNPLDIALKLEGEDAHADLKLQPTEFGAWWSRLLAASPEHPPGPLPFTGHAEAQRLDLGWLKATGLRIDADPDLTPAPSTSSPAASSAASAH